MSPGPGPRLRAAPRAAALLQGRLKLARLLAMPEADFALLVRGLEREPDFSRLLAQGVLERAPFPRSRIAARRFGELSFAPAKDALGDVLDGDSRIVGLLRKAGRERFEECFLRGDGLRDAERARRCGLSEEEARFVREWLDRLYIRSESEPSAPAPARRLSPVAGFEAARGGAALKFFNREVWKARYRVDEARLKAHLETLDPGRRARTAALVRRLALLNLRKTTLYRALEELGRLQADYLKTGEPGRRQAVTQRSLALVLGVSPSSLNRLISNKCVELPWGTEAPMKALLPSAKALALGRLEALARERPDASDEALRAELAGRHQVHLSRRSVAQYRKDLGLGPSRSRAEGPPRA